MSRTSKFHQIATTKKQDCHFDRKCVHEFGFKLKPKGTEECQ